MYQGILKIGTREWYVDIATTFTEVAQGLGGVVAINPGTGMLFILDCPQIVDVTTYPMLFNLDIAFLRDGVVVEKHENITPWHIVTSSELADSFFEVNAGELSDVEVGATTTVTATEAPLMPPSFMTYIIPLLTIGIMGGLGVGLMRAMMKPPAPKALPPSTEKALGPPIGTALVPYGYYTDTEAKVDRSLFRFQTEIDDAFTEAIRRVRTHRGGRE